MKLRQCRRTLMPLGQSFFRFLIFSQSFLCIALMFSKYQLSLRMSIRNFWRLLNFRLLFCQLPVNPLQTLYLSGYVGTTDLLVSVWPFHSPTQLPMHILHHTHILLLLLLLIIIIVLQDICDEHLNKGSNKAQDARLDIHAHGFWERHWSAFFDVRVCHPNAISYKDLKPQQIYHIPENEKKRLYSRRVLYIGHGAFTPSAFTTTGRMGKQCLMYQPFSTADCHLMDQKQNLIRTLEICFGLS